MIKNFKKLSERVLIVSGEMGSGKTVLANQIKDTIGYNCTIYDDFSYKTSNRPKKRIEYEILGKIAQLRHIDETLVICVNRYPTGLTRLFNREYFGTIFGWVFTSINMMDFYDYPITVPKPTVVKFMKKYMFSITKKRKTRPYLLVTKDEQKMGRYKIAS